MRSPVKRPLSFEEFRRLIAEELNVEESRITPESSFIRDLLADSIKLVELMLRLEEMGVDIPVEAAWEMETVGDAYRLYTEHVAALLNNLTQTP